MKLSRDIHLTSISSAISGLGSAMSAVFIPLIIYADTHNPILTALQVTCFAIGNLIACRVVVKYKIARTDKQALVICNVLAGMAMVFLALVPTIMLLPCLFLAATINALLDTAARGYYESLIGVISEAHDIHRQSLVGRFKTFENLGTIIGTCLAAPMLAFDNSSIVFLIDASTFFIAAGLIARLHRSGLPLVVNHSSKLGWNVLLKSKIRMLTLSHCLLAVALFMMNGTVIYVMKNEFSVSDTIVSYFYVSQFVCGTVGACLISKIAAIRPVKKAEGQYLRLLYSVPLLLIAASNSELAFVFLISLLSLVHAFSIPVWQSYFQESADERSEWRVIGATRKTLVSVMGAIASMISGILLTQYHYKVVYLIAGVCCLFAFLVMTRLRIFQQEGYSS